MSRYTSTSILIGSLLLSGCAGADTGAADAVVREDSLGVEIVWSPAADRPLDWTLTETMRLGGASDGPQSFTRVGSYNLGADRSGNLYLMDSDASHVVVFDARGEHLRSMGGKGGGPGEFEFPLGLSVTPAGVTAVFDIGKGGLVPFGPDGSPLAQVPFPYFTNPGVKHFQKTDEGVTVARRLQLADRRGLELIAWRDDDLTGDTITFVHMEYDPPEMVDFGCMGLALRPLFAPSVRWARAGEQIAAAWTGDYRVDLYRPDGTLMRSIRRALPRNSATLEDAIAEAEPGMRMRGASECSVTAAEVAEGRGYAETTPAIRNILLAADGTLWVERYEPGSPATGRSGPIDVFDPTGAYIGSPPAGTRFPILLLPGDQIAIAEKDALDVERLIVLRVERPSAKAEAP